MRQLLFILISCISFASCKSAFEHNKAGMEKLSAELIEEFGAEAWYTSIELENAGSSDDLVSVQQTNDPNSLKQEQWVQAHGFWNKAANVTLTIQGAEPKSFMFQLNKDMSLSKLGELIETSTKSLQEKDVKDTELTLASMKASNQMNTKQEGFYYSVILRNKADGKSFRFIYDINGKLKSLDE